MRVDSSYKAPSPCKLYHFQAFLIQLDEQQMSYSESSPYFTSVGYDKKDALIRPRIQSPNFFKQSNKGSDFILPSISSDIQDI
jgi:hypothetical protein